MKVQIHLLFLFILSLVISISAQSVTITPKKSIYRRAKPISEFKKTFTVRYPIVKAASPSVSKKIESTISYAKVMELNIQDEIKDIQWLEEADYEVNYNAKWLLVITLSVSGTGAYPDTASKTIAVDLKTGNRITPAQAFKNISGLVELIKQKQKVEIEAAIKELREDPEEKERDPAELFSEESFTADSLQEFSLNDSGITFIYNYGFPHVIQAFEPEGRYTYKWSEVAKFINPAGPLAKFVVK